MEKYTGKKGEKHPKGLRYAKIVEFPDYLVLCFKRFKNNGYLIEKDATHLLYRDQLVINSDGRKI